jgi:two-component system KDP operon response regulator KdpE
MSASPLILLVEDEAPMRRFLRAALQAQGYRCLEALDAAEGTRLLASHQPDLVLLDLGLPDRDGLELAREWRGWSQVPVIVLSARGREEDKIQALDAGADDYLTKPFSTGELMARIRVAFRHRGETAAEAPIYQTAHWSLDQARREFRVGGTVVHLTPNEFKLLQVLVRHAGRVVTHTQLLREVWGTAAAQPHYVRVYMAQLRQKLEPDPARPRYLLTEPGVGYRLRTEEA